MVNKMMTQCKCVSFDFLHNLHNKQLTMGLVKHEGTMRKVQHELNAVQNFTLTFISLHSRSKH
jgi:hypothetical protein